MWITEWIVVCTLEGILKGVSSGILRNKWNKWKEVNKCDVGYVYIITCIV